jgi:hypothetical protein
MTVAYTFGWRKREVLDLEKHQYSARTGPSGWTPEHEEPGGPGRQGHAGATSAARSQVPGP